MDPLTHAALGATLGQAGFRRSLGRRALAVGAVVAASPDLDLLPALFAAEPWIVHRGLTHSLPYAATAGAVLGWACWRWPRLAGSGGLGAWVGLCIAALLSHVLLDTLTPGGVALLAPFLDDQVGVPAMPVVDPAFSAVLAAAVLAGLLVRRRPALGQALAWAALLVAFGYAAFGWIANERVATEARRQLAQAHVVAVVQARPTPLQPFVRRVEAEIGGKVHVGFRSVLSSGPIVWHATATGSGRRVSWQVTADGRVAVVQGPELRYRLLGVDVVRALGGPAPVGFGSLWELVFG